MIKNPANQKYYNKLRNDPVRYEATKQREREKAKKDYYSKSKEERRLQQATPEFKEKRKKIRKMYRDKHTFWRLARNLQRKNDKSIKPIDLWILCKKQKCRCAITGEKLTGKNVSCDHIIPVSVGGKNIIGNIQLTTLKANLCKNTMSHTELVEFCKLVYLKSLERRE